MTRPNRSRRRRVSRHRTVAALAALGFLMGTSVGIGAPAAASGLPEEVYAPSSVPDRIVLTPTAATSNSQNVTWRTAAGVSTPQAQIAPTSPGPNFTGSAETVPATTSTPLETDQGYESTYHTVTFDNLEPATTYLYRVGDGTNWSEWSEFTTSAASETDFSFIYYGDAQNDVKEHVSRVFRNAITDRPRAELLVHAGDLVNTADSDAEWGEWFHAAGWINGTVNVLATPGNHEYDDQQLSPQWQPQFEFPGNGPDWSELPDEYQDFDLPAVLDETVYYVDHKGVRFISLNSNVQEYEEALALQAEWLDAVLEENSNHWTVVTFHHPVFPVAEGRDNPQLREHWLPVLQEHDVDLVLTGHDHAYGRGNVLDNSTAARPAEQPSVREYDGTVYVISVAGPKMYDLDGDVWADNGALLRRTAQDRQLYQLIDVSSDQVRYEARTATGRYYDGLTIFKDADGVKKVVDDEDPENFPPDGDGDGGDDGGGGSDDGGGGGSDDGGGGSDDGGGGGSDDGGSENGGDDTDAGDQDGGDSGTEDGDGNLPDTGASLTWLIGGVALLVAGSMLVVATRRKAGIEL